MISLDLRNKIVQYQIEEITLEQLVDWIVPREPKIFANPTSDDADVTATMELWFAEISEGIRTEKTFRVELRDLLRKHDDVLEFVGITESRSSTGSSNDYVQVPPFNVYDQFYGELIIS